MAAGNKQCLCCQRYIKGVPNSTVRKPSSVVTFLVALVALVVVGYLNQAAFRSGGHPDAEEARQAELTADQIAKQKSAPATPSSKSATTPFVSSTAAAPITELTIGNPTTAPTKLTYGYSADEQVERDPTSLDASTAALQQYAQSHPSTSLQIVCLDIPANDLSDKSKAAIPAGLYKNGKLVMALSATLSPKPLDESDVVRLLG